MANDTCSRRKANDDGYTNERQTNEKSRINSGSSMSGTTGLRRSARETSSKKMIASPSSTQNSEQLEKRTPPTLAVRRSPKQVEKQNTPSPLRRSLRTMGYSLTSSEFESSGSPSSKQKMPRKDMSMKQMIEDKEVNQNEKHDVIDVGPSQVKSRRMNARDYRAMFKIKAKTEFQKQLDRVDELTEEGRNNDGGKRDESFNESQTELKENVVEPHSRMFKWVEESLEDNCAELDQSSRKDGAIDEAKSSKNLDCKEAFKNCNQNLISDVPARIADEDNCNLIADADSSRSCECKVDSTLGTCGTCSNGIRKRKRIQHFDGSVNRFDVESDDISKKCRKVNNNVDKPSSRTEDEGRLFTGKMEGNSEDPVGNVSQLLPSSCASVNGPLYVNYTYYPTFFIDQVSERPQGNEFESEEGKKLRDDQRSLLLSLKPTVAKLCDVLHLPDNVKIMVDNFLEYVMNNHQVHREPASILQAFQISLCWTAASLLKHKIGHKTSLKLARQHLNFDCKKEEADYIYSMLRCLKGVFLYRTGNFCNNLSPEASESSNRVDSCTGVVLAVDEQVKLDISKSKREIQKKCQKQLRKLLVKQQQEKEKLNATNEEEKAALERQYEIESALVRHSIPNEATRTRKLKILDNEYAKKIEALKCRHEKNLKDLEGVQLAARHKFEDKEAIWLEEVESWVKMELSNMPLSKGLQTGVEYFQSSEEVQSQDGPKNVGDHVTNREDCDKMDEARTGTGIGLSVAPEIMSNIPCRKSVELQTPLVEHASSDVDTMASGGGLISQNENHYRAENICDSQANNASVHSYSKEQNLDGPIGMANKGEGNQNFSSGGCRVDKVTSVQPSSGRDICDGASPVVPNGEMDVEVQEGDCSTNGLGEIPSSRQGILDGTISRVPACGLLSGEVEATNSGDGAKNIASVNSQSSEENIQTGTARCMPNNENAAQSHEYDDSNISNNAATLNSPLSEKRIADGPTVNVLDREESLQMPGTGSFTDCPVNDVPVNPSLSMERTSDGSAMEILDRVVSSRLGEPASPTNGPDTIGLSNSPMSGQQIPVEGSLSTPDVQAAVEMLQTSPNVARFHDGIESQTDAISLNKSTTSDLQGVSRTLDENNLSQETLVLRSPSPLALPSVISSQAAISINEALQDPCTSSFSPSRMVDDDATVEEMQNSNHVVELVSNPVNIVPQNQSNNDSLSLETLEEGELLPSAESLLNHNIAGVLQDSDSSQQVDLVSSSVDLPVNQSNYEPQVEEPPEQGQHLPSAQSPSNQDAPGEMLDCPEQDEPVCCPVDFVPVNQSNHESLVTMPVEQVQQLPTAQSPCSNQDPSTTPLAIGIEHQPTIENSHSCHVPQPSISVSNQPVMQPVSNSEHDLHAPVGIIRTQSSDTVQPVSNSEHDLHAPVGIIRTQSSDTRNMSTPSVINNFPTETESWPLSRRPLPMQSDPLNNELERIHKEAEQTQKNHEDMKLQLKSDCDKEIAEILSKYETKLKQSEDEFQLRKKDLDNSFHLVFMNKVLAEAFKSKCADPKACGTSGMQQDASYAQQPVQLPRQQGAITRPNLVSGISTPGIPAASLQPTSTTVNSQATMVPPVQAVFNTPGIVSSVPSTRPPHFNPISPPTQNVQVGSEIRSPAPHLQPYRPPTAIAPLHGMSNQQAANSIPRTSAPPHGASNLQAPNCIPTTPVLLPHLVPRSTVSNYRSGMHLPENARGLPMPNLSAMGSHADANSQYGLHINVMQRMLDAAVLNPSQFDVGTRMQTNSGNQSTAMNSSQFNVSTSMQVNSGNQSTSLDVVCLSDDE